MEEFDEDCSERLCDLANASLCTEEDQPFTYVDSDIDCISMRLGIWWEASKSIPFGTEVPYLGFHWDLQTHLVHLPEEKKSKY